jgi:D-psicose/D-tagatose/L-ribulose 3-epimerase
MKTAVSNLAWSAGFSAETATSIVAAQIEGVEIAPTVIWPDIDGVTKAKVVDERNKWLDSGLEIAAIQSLLFGRGELNLFDQSAQPAMRERLLRMAEVAYWLGAGIAVFGSPRNRIKGELSRSDAMEVAAEFFRSLTPGLESNGVVLTLEPNAPIYGADFLTHYADCIELADLIASDSVGVQIDTGCLNLVGSNAAEDLALRQPQHVHVSSPQLAPLPGPVDHLALSTALDRTHYRGWVTMEMKNPQDPGKFDECLNWLALTYGTARA